MMSYNSLIILWMCIVHQLATTEKIQMNYLKYTDTHMRAHTYIYAYIHHMYLLYMYP